jgi:hypothetical protein
MNRLSDIYNNIPRMYRWGLLHFNRLDNLPGLLENHLLHPLLWTDFIPVLGGQRSPVAFPPAGVGCFFP